jgi:hypothetical protein
VLDGYGLAVLNNARDNVAVSMYYGIRGGHGHFDRLTLELFARGRRLTPDLGYPDFMNAFVPGIFSWSKNTISHNTLTVDEMPQNRNRHGRVLRFCDSPTVDVVDVDGQGSYDPTDVYRRTLVLVETGENDAYLVDVFRVRGGAKHVLSLHGQEGAFTLYGADLSPPVSEGTLAGADVEYGALYDDPKLSVPGYKGSYGGYKGSGYSHFFNWQRAAPEEIVTGQWTLAGEPAASLRAHVLPHPGQELIVADAYVSPTQKEPTVLKYMLARRSTAEAGNTFAVVWEPYADKPQIDRIKVHHAPSDGHADRVAFKVLRGDTADTVLVADAPGTSRAVDPAFETDAAVAVTSVRDGRVIRAFATGGTRLASQTADDPIRIPVTITGLIQQVDYNQRRITVNTSVSESDAASLVGQTVRIANEHHASVYRIAGAGVSDETLTLDLTGSDVFTGRIKLGKVDPQAKTVATKTKVLYPFDLDGMTLVTEDLRHQARIRSMDNGVIRLTEDEDAKPFTTEGKDAWIADFGFGDSATIERSIHRHDP